MRNGGLSVNRKFAQEFPSCCPPLPAATPGTETVGLDGTRKKPTASLLWRIQRSWPNPKRGLDSDPLSGGTSHPSPPLTIAQHSQHVCDELDVLLQAFAEIPAAWKTHLSLAARWHDLGKAHDAISGGRPRANPALSRNELWAKSGTNNRLRHGRKYFRHELASALACLQAGCRSRQCI